MPIVLFELINSDITKNSSKVINFLDKFDYDFYQIKGDLYEYQNKFQRLLNTFIHLLIPKNLYFEKININKIEKKNYVLILAYNKSKKN